MRPIHFCQGSVCALSYTLLLLYSIEIELGGWIVVKLNSCPLNICGLNRCRIEYHVADYFKFAQAEINNRLKFVSFKETHHKFIGEHQNFYNVNRYSLNKTLKMLTIKNWRLGLAGGGSWGWTHTSWLKYRLNRGL
jgi:hypothetical protein